MQFNIEANTASEFIQKTLENLPDVDIGLLSLIMGEFMVSGAFGDYPEVQVSLSLVSKEEMRALNGQYRDIHEPTDVLSFPLWEDDGMFAPPEGWEMLPLGDVVVSPEYILDYAQGLHAEYEREIVLVLIHGILHLLGFDHDTGEKERRLMWKEQEALRETYFDRIRGGLRVE